VSTCRDKLVSGGETTRFSRKRPVSAYKMRCMYVQAACTRLLRLTTSHAFLAPYSEDFL
jgi:hypothetical protein